MKLNRIKNLMIVGLLTLTVGCADLAVENLNEPETERALASSEDLEGLANGLYRDFYLGNHNFGAQMALAVGADAATASWGNAGMQLMGTEPRPAWDNSPNFSYAYVTEDQFEDMYSINSSATDVLKAMASGIEFDNPNMIEAFAKFNQALSIGYIGLMFDQGYIVDENTTDEEISNPTLRPYGELIDHAVAKLNEVITISEANTFSLNSSMMQTTATMDNVFLEKLAHSYAARFLANAPRNLAETQAVDWSAVRTHAQNGIDSDFIVIGTSDFLWYNYSGYYLVNPGWGRVDHYVINKMDPTYPAHNPDGTDYPAPDSANVVDERLFSDFQYLPSNNFRAERGLYFFSNFRHSRTDYYIGSWDGDLREVTTSEMDMYIAESHYHDQNYVLAKTVIDNSERISRGNMDPVLATEEEIWKAIHHERLVEQFNTGVGLEFFQMRKYDKLQEGTLLHFPIPASTLEVLGMTKPFYTFGGVDNADGQGTSSGGWR
ncbi:MAG: hypothetical protein HUJ22_07420 [Gracilimonas sp.]|uniref:hypothetical protein n=1 Tax=Gracilimonas sp. TaxID=1974203 RepID=UPI001986B33F|nr:hypothetical protein [Gracilimonas sp.]MBD3616386.1 hypothetical protein [Gracilimonas sp.]